MEMIDILLPTYNGEKYIEEQIDSLLNQSYKNINIILRDDGSKDKTVDIINKKVKEDKRIKFLKDHKGNVGLVKGIEILLNASTSDYIMYCDQDDVWFKKKVEILYEIIKCYDKEKSCLVHSDCYVTDKNLKIKYKFKGKKPFLRGIHNCYFNYYVQGASSIFNKKLKEKLLPFPTNIYIHDRYTHLVAELEGERIYIEDPLMYYRQHNNNLIGSKGILQKINNNLKIIFNKNYFNKEFDLFKQLYERNQEYKEKIQPYFILLDKKNNLLQKIKIIKKYKIKMRLKEKILIFFFKNLLK